MPTPAKTESMHRLTGTKTQVKAAGESALQAGRPENSIAFKQKRKSAVQASRIAA